MANGRQFFRGRTGEGQRFLTNIPERALELGGPQIEALPAPRGIVPIEQRAQPVTVGGQQGLRQRIEAKGREIGASQAQVDAELKRRGLAKAQIAAPKAFAPVTLVDKSGRKILHIPTFDPNTGAAKLAVADLPEGFELSKETAEEKRQAEVATVGAKKEAEVTGKGIGVRRQAAINKGIDASEGFANLVRARDLLESIPTGGVSAVSLRAKQIFGVEGADEAELSNRMGKAVLSQLRATFGAAFTAKEGDQLKDIEAGFGKSTEGNRRLIEQTMKIVGRASRRGIRAAEAAGDLEAAQDIRDALAFRLDVAPSAPAGNDLTLEEQNELAELKRRFRR